MSELFANLKSVMATKGKRAFPFESILSSTLATHNFTKLFFFSGNICEGKQFKKTIRHPFLCTSYITCLGENFEVHECENGVCFDEESGKCGQTGILYLTH